MRTVVLVPRRADHSHRDRLWEWCLNRWHCEHPDLPVYEGHHDDGPFNRSAALNLAAAAAGDWDVAIVADSDSFVSTDQIHQAVDTCRRTGQVTFAYDRYCYLSRQMSQLVMSGYFGDWYPGVEFTMVGTCSSMLAVPRGPWDEMGGADEGFVGWGGEDIAISLGLQTFGGGMQRIRGDVWHLWHPTAPRSVDTFVDRIKSYSEAAYDPVAMRDLIARIKHNPMVHA